MAFVGSVVVKNGGIKGCHVSRADACAVGVMKKSATPRTRVSMAVQPTGVQPEDYFFLAGAAVVLVGAFLLQKSLGDVVADEAGLPPAGSAKSRREAQRSSRFLQKKKKDDDE